jgi:hypothetical protein
MAEEESWAPMRGFIRELTSRRIAQWWLGHANDAGEALPWPSFFENNQRNQTNGKRWRKKGCWPS